MQERPRKNCKFFSQNLVMHWKHLFRLNPNVHFADWPLQILVTQLVITICTVRCRSCVSMEMNWYFWHCSTFQSISPSAHYSTDITYWKSRFPHCKTTFAGTESRFWQIHVFQHIHILWVNFPSNSVMPGFQDTSLWLHAVELICCIFWNVWCLKCVVKILLCI